MHRFIFIATFLPAVFLMDLLATSASIPKEPMPRPIQSSTEISGMTSSATVAAVKEAQASEKS